MLLDQKNKHERDTRIEFNEEQHIYTIDKEQGYTSVTQYIHSLFSPFDKKKVATGIVNSTKNKKPEYVNKTVDEIIKLWDDNCHQAATAGTKMHYDIECYYNDVPNENDSIEYKYFIDFKNKFNYLKPYRTEWCVFDKDLLFAGSIDMVFYNENTKKYDIYDWKRCKCISKTNNWNKYSTNGLIDYIPDTNFWHYCLQLNIYKKILETNYNIEVDDLYIVCLHPNQTSYERHKIVNLQDEVKLLFDERLNYIRSIKK